jgi:flagellar biosynthesis protein FliR
MDPMTYTANQAQIFMLSLVRIASMLALMPIFGSASIPAHLKAGLALVLCFILFPFIQQHTNLPLPQTTGMFVYKIILEVFVGVVIGFVATLLFTAAQFAGYMIDALTGFSFVELVDPFTDTSVTVFGQFNVLVFTIVFFLVNGHYFLLLAIEKSFEVIPLLGVAIPTGKLAAFLTQQTGAIFAIAFKLSAPIFVTLMITQVALGVVARTVPQINVFFVGIPLNIAVAFGTAIIVLPNLVSLFRSLVDRLMQDIWKLLYMMA